MLGLIPLEHGLVVVEPPSVRTELVPYPNPLQQQLCMGLEVLEVAHEVEGLHVCGEAAEVGLRPPANQMGTRARSEVGGDV